MAVACFQGATSGSVEEQRLGSDAYLSLSVWAIYSFLTLLLQLTSGAEKTAFTSYPDEASHFVGAVMIRTWLFSKSWLRPLAFARDYYSHYPYFAVGYWPPAFHLVSGLWMGVAGVGRAQALVVPALFASTTAWAVFFLTKQIGRSPIAISAGAIYLILPVVQASACAVMVDHMTACLCLLSGVFLLRYVRDPSYSTACVVALVSALAILSKYSAAYLLMFPLFALPLLRKKDLILKMEFWLQPALIGLLVLPWAIWTRKLAFYGIPAHITRLTLSRPIILAEQLLTAFPRPVLLVIVGGLVALALSWQFWTDEIAVVGLLGLAHLTFIYISPVEIEPRYLLLPIACVVILSFAGWEVILKHLEEAPRLHMTVSAALLGISGFFVLIYFGHYPKPPDNAVTEIVSVVLGNRTEVVNHIVVPPEMEGPFIAEFVSQEKGRPVDYLVRSNRLIATSDWFGRNYSLLLHNPREVAQCFQRQSVTKIIWHDRPSDLQLPHERLIKQMLLDDRFEWRMEDFRGSKSNGVPSGWSLYAYTLFEGLLSIKRNVKNSHQDQSWKRGDEPDL